MVVDNETKGITLSDMRLLMKAAELGGLASAARVLGIPKASATRQLQRLEQVVGSRLIHRTGRRFALTEEGRALLPYAQRGVAALEDGVRHLREQHGPLSGELRIAAPYTYGRKVLGPMMPLFHREHPGLLITLSLGSSHVDLLADAADIAVRIGDPGGGELIARKLSVETFVLCASSAYLSSAAPLTRPADLAVHPFVDLRTNALAGDIKLEGPSGERRVSVKPVLRSNEPEVVIQAVLAGMGIAIVPRSMTPEFFAAGLLTQVLPDWVPPPRDVNALYAPGRGGAPKIRAFLDFLVRELATKPASLSR